MADLDNTTNPGKISDYFRNTVETYGLQFNDQNDFYRYTIKRGTSYMLQVAYYVPTLAELGQTFNERPVVPCFDPRDEDLHFTPARLHNACIRDGNISTEWHKAIKYQIVIYYLQRGEHPRMVSSLAGSTPSKFEEDLTKMLQKLDEFSGVSSQG